MNTMPSEDVWFVVKNLYKKLDNFCHYVIIYEGIF